MSIQGDSIVYIGTYTEAPAGRAEGLFVYRMDRHSGMLRLEQTVSGVIDPSFVTLAPDGRYLYAVSEADEGQVLAFARDLATGHLTLLNQQSTHGTAPCHLSCDHGYVLVANYGSGSIAAFPVGSDGSLSPASSVVQHEGSSVHERQEGPHAHMILPSPTHQLVLAVDLGLDRILAYRLDAESGQLISGDPPVAYESPQPGAGPRQVAFHPNGLFAYVLNELGSTLTACEYDAAQGVLRPFQTLSTLPDGFDAENTSAHVIVSSSGRFAYTSNRGHDSIAIFAIEEATGSLTVVGHEATRGANPRAFALDQTGNWLLAANQDSDTVVSLRVDQSTGLLTPSGHEASIPTPVCVLFAQG